MSFVDCIPTWLPKTAHVFTLSLEEVGGPALHRLWVAGCGSTPSHGHIQPSCSARDTQAEFLRRQGRPTSKGLRGGRNVVHVTVQGPPAMRVRDGVSAS